MSIQKSDPVSINNVNNNSSDNLSSRQLVALEAMMTRAEGENLESVAARAGITVRSLHRYLIDPDFDRAFRKRVKAEIGSHRKRVSKALIDGATKPGTGQASMQKLFWQLIGDFTDSLEISGPDGGPIQIENMPIPIDDFSLEDKRAIIEIIERNRRRIEGARTDIDDTDNGNSNTNNGNDIEVEYRVLGTGNENIIEYGPTSELPMTYEPSSEEEEQ